MSGTREPAAMLPPPDWSKLSLIVRKARRQECESLRAFGRRIGVHHAIVDSVEKGESVKVDGYLRLCAGLKLDPFEACGMTATREGPA